MGRNSKWIESHPDDCVERIARKALDARLERMWHFLKLSVRAWRSDSENVHQLRVFSRRAASALEIFEPWLPAKRAAWIRKQVKRIRKAAGDARDFDVLLERWSKRTERDQAELVTLLLEEIKNRRREAQLPVDKVFEKLERKDFDRRTRKFLKHIGPRPDSDHDERFGCVARQSLARMAVPYLAAAQAEMADAESLHAFRIQGKQVRYAMEVFAGAFDEDFRQSLYPLVANLQDRLGIINDHVTAERYFAQWRDDAQRCSTRESLEMAIECERSGSTHSQLEFRSWWTPERRQELSARFARHVDISGSEPPKCP